MASERQHALNFREQSARAVQNSSVRSAVSAAVDLLSSKRSQGIALLPFDEFREKASTMRMQVLDDLNTYVNLFAANATRAGAVVHRADDAKSAVETIFYLLKDRGVERVVKAKSMVTEEIHLNRHLESRGIEVVETDLGEYIVQMAGEPPSHILGPAIHKNRREIGELFANKLAVEYTDDPSELNRIARKALRKKFLQAQGGITGANFAIADTGSIVLFSNEGNIRMTTTLPPIHVAVVSIEKIIPRFIDVPLFARLLARSATGQPLSSYMSIISGTRKPDETTGAREMHIILVDNGRSAILQGDCREILKCIRCSACINVCPVYRTIGGHAYQSTYSGPMGIILTVLLEGLEVTHELLDGTTLCGACDHVCPVRVPLTGILRTLRDRRVQEGLSPTTERAVIGAMSLGISNPALYKLGQKMSRVCWPMVKKVMGTTNHGRFPEPVGTTFRRRMC